MIGVPGQPVQNSDTALGGNAGVRCAQAGLAVAVAPALNRALGPGLVRRVLSTANNIDGALPVAHGSCRDRRDHCLPDRTVAATVSREQGPVVAGLGWSGW